MAKTNARVKPAHDKRKGSKMTQTDKLLSRKEAGVGIVTFNNPERLNAVSLDMWEAAKRARRFAADDEVRVVVLTGAGGKAFVSGADISKFASERASPKPRAPTT
jgi:enoyl-CoA hydratase